MSLSVQHFFSVSSLTFLSRLTGFANTLLLMAALGLTDLSDAFMWANVLPNILYELVLGGLMGSVFLPLFAKWRTEVPDADYRREAANLVNTILFWMLLLSVIACIISPWLVELIASRSDSEVAQDQATYFFRFFAFQIFFYAMSGLASVLLNLEKKFTLAALAPVLNNLTVTVTLLLFMVTPAEWQLMLLGVGVTLGVGVMAVVQLVGLMRLGWSFATLPSAWHPRLSRAIALGVPLMLLVLVQQAALGVRINLSSSVEGGFTALQHVFRFFQLPYGIIAVTIGTLIMPRLADAAAQRSHANFRSDTRRAVGWTLGLMLPCALIYSWLAPYLMDFLQFLGRLESSDTALLGDLLRIYALALFPYSLLMLVLRFFYAQSDTWTPLVIQSIAAVFNIILCLTLFPIAGLMGIATAVLLSYSIGLLAALLLYQRFTKRKLSHPKGD